MILLQSSVSVLVHPQLNMANNNKSPKPGHSHSAENSSLEADDFRQDNECLPTENVAVIEDLMSEEKMENLRAMVNGNVRKKLYFNPAYFEPHLLAVCRKPAQIHVQLNDAQSLSNLCRSRHKLPLSFFKRFAR